MINLEIIIRKKVFYNAQLKYNCLKDYNEKEIFAIM